MSAIHLLLKNWREGKIYKKIPLGLLRWFPCVREIWEYDSKILI